MKTVCRNLVVILCTVLVLNNLYSQNQQENELDVMKGIRQNTQADFVKDDFNIIAIFSIIIAFVSFLFSVKTYREQKATKDNTKKLSQDAQRHLMNDLIRHLYRNYVITCALRTKLDEIEFGGYPSEEHLYKLKIPMENIHLEAFLGDEEKYRIIHNLYLNLRNYNEEVLVALAHFKDKYVDIQTKNRDFDTLEFKVSFLTKRIVETEYHIWGEQVKNSILQSLNVAVNNTTSATGNIPIEDYGDSNEIPVERIKKTYYAELFDYDQNKIIEFAKKLNDAIKTERMLNERGAEKIHIIRFTSQ